jgi:hypothetical protein
MLDEAPLKKFNEEQLVDIMQALELSDELKRQLLSYDNSTQRFNHLFSGGEYQAALNLMALSLPKREAIWWGYVCLEKQDSLMKDTQTQSVMQLIEAWVRHPDDDKRRTAKKMADHFDCYTAPSWLAMAIFWSGGSIAPLGQFEVEAKPFMAGHAVFNAISMVVESDVDCVNLQKQYLKQGLHVAMGGDGRLE